VKQKRLKRHSLPEVVPKPGRLVLTQDQLVSVMRGQDAEAASRRCAKRWNKLLEPAIRQAMTAIEETRLEASCKSKKRRLSKEILC